ncbi:MAG: hypothetical protein SNJ64_03020, partial [Endomicrobiia bacterium]
FYIEGEFPREENQIRQKISELQVDNIILQNNLNRVQITKENIPENLQNWLFISINDDNMMKIFNTHEFRGDIELNVDGVAEKVGAQVAYDALIKVYNKISTNEHNEHNEHIKHYKYEPENNPANRYYLFYRYLNNINVLLLFSIKKNLNTNEIDETKRIILDNNEYLNEEVTEITLRENINKFSHEYMEIDIYECKNWKNILEKQSLYHALSEEERNIVNQLTTDPNGKQYPTFITGRAGSGKTLMLQYLVYNYLCKTLNYYNEGEATFFPIYLTYSKKLIDEAKSRINIKVKHYMYNKNYKGFDNFREEYEEKTFFQYIKFLCEKIIKKNEYLENYVGFSHFYEWFNSNGFNFDVYQSWYIIRTYIKGMAADGYDLTEEEFSSNPFVKADKHDVSIEDFNNIYEQVYLRYKNYLKERNLKDEQDIAIEALKNVNNIDKYYAAIICDEAQDFTYVDFQLIGRISAFAYYNCNNDMIGRIPLVLAGDHLQTINPSGYNFKKVKSNYFVLYQLIFNVDIIWLGQNEHVLAYNYRSVPSIVKISNLIIENRNKYLEESYAYQDTWRLNQNDAYSWGIISVEDFKKANNDVLKNKIFIVFDEQKRNEMCQLLNNKGLQDVIIYTPQEAKGLEFSSVIIYKFSEHQPPFDANDNIKLSYFFNCLYVSVTRAENKLYIVDDYNNTVWEKIFTEKKDMYNIIGDNDNIFPGTRNIGQDGPEGIRYDAKKIFENAENVDLPKERRIQEYQNAKHLYSQLGDEQKQITLCKARINELNNLYQDAANEYLSINNINDYLRCLWLGNNYNNIVEYADANPNIHWRDDYKSIIELSRKNENIDEEYLDFLFPDGKRVEVNFIYKNERVVSKSIDFIEKNNDDKCVLRKIIWLKSLLYSRDVGNTIKSRLISIMSNLFERNTKEGFDNNQYVEVAKILKEKSMDIDKLIIKKTEAYLETDIKEKLKIVIDLIITDKQTSYVEYFLKKYIENFEKLDALWNDFKKIALGWVDNCIKILELSPNKDAILDKLDKVDLLQLLNNKDDLLKNFLIKNPSKAKEIIINSSEEFIQNKKNVIMGIFKIFSIEQLDEIISRITDEQVRNSIRNEIIEKIKNETEMSVLEKYLKRFDEEISEVIKKRLLELFEKNPEVDNERMIKDIIDDLIGGSEKPSQITLDKVMSIGLLFKDKNLLKDIYDRLISFGKIKSKYDVLSVGLRYATVIKDELEEIMNQERYNMNNIYKLLTLKYFEKEHSEDDKKSPKYKNYNMYNRMLKETLTKNNFKELFEKSLKGDYPKITEYIFSYEDEWMLKGNIIKEIRFDNDLLFTYNEGNDSWEFRDKYNNLLYVYSSQTQQLYSPKNKYRYEKQGDNIYKFSNIELIIDDRNNFRIKIT